MIRAALQETNYNDRRLLAEQLSNFCSSITLQICRKSPEFLAR